MKDGLTFAGALTMLFIALKLTSVIAWSWWWVLCLAWLPIALVIGIPLCLLILTMISDLAELITVSINKILNKIMGRVKIR